MAKTKTKINSSWHSKYDQPRRVLQDQLESYSPDFVNPSIRERFDNESYEDYIQGQQDSNLLDFSLNNPIKYKEIEDENYWNKEVDRYDERRKNIKDKWNEASEKSSILPKYENTPFLDKIIDVVDFIDNNLPGQQKDYTKIEFNKKVAAIGAFNPALGLITGIASSDWGADFWNHLGRKMNDFQIGDYQGYIDRATNLNYLVESEKKSLYLEQLIQDIDKEIQNTAVQSPETKVLFSDQLSAKVGMLNKQKQELLKELNELNEDKKALDSYKTNFITEKFDDAMRFISPIADIISNNRIFGRTSQVRDEFSDIIKELNKYNRSTSIAERQKQLENVQKQYVQKVQEWNEGIESNLKDKESYGKVSDFYQNIADNQEILFFNPNTYLFGLSGLIAGSVSSMNKQIPAMITGFASGNALAAGALTADPGALAGGAAGTLSTYYLNRMSSVTEANSEVSESITNNLRKSLIDKGLYNQLIDEGRKKIKNSSKLTDDEIFNAYRRGLFSSSNSIIQDENVKAHIGVESVFQDEMTAITFSDLIDTGLEVMPLGSGIGAKLLKTPFSIGIKHAVRSNKYWRKLITSEPAKRAIRSKFGQHVFDDAGSSFARGSVISPVAGLANIPMHIALSPIEKYVGNNVRKGIAKSLQWTSDALSVAPEEILSKALTASTTTKYIKDLSGRVIVSSLAEGIEEGKQGYIQRRMEEGGYNSNVVKSIWDSVLDDFIAGSKSAGLILGMPFGITPDKEILNQIKGGMLMGVFGPGTVVSTVSSVKPYIKEQSANKFIIDNFLNNKFDAINRFNKGVIYAEKAKTGDAYNSVLDAFNRLINLNDKVAEENGQPMMDNDIINNEISMFKKTAQEATNLYTIKSAESQGIKQNTPEYNQFVSAKVMALDEIDAYTEARDESQSNLNQARDKILTEYAEEQLKHVSSAIPGQAQEEQQQLSEQHKMGFYYTDTLAHYVALLKRKQEVEIGILNAESNNNSQIKSQLQDQLTNIDQQLALMKTSLKVAGIGDTVDMNSIDNVESNLVYDRESHDILVPLYKEYTQSIDDLTLAVTDLKDLTGKLQIKDGDKWRDLTNEDYVDPESEDNEGKFDPSKDIDKVKYEGGKARSIINKYKKVVQSDAQLQQNMADAYRDRIVNTSEELSEGAIDKQGRVIDQEKVDKIENTPKVQQEDPKEAFRQEVEEKPKQKPAAKEETPDTHTQNRSKQPQNAPESISEGRVDNPSVDKEKRILDTVTEQSQQPTNEKSSQQMQSKPKDTIKVEIGSEYGKNNKVITQEKYNSLVDKWKKLHGRLNSGPVTSAELLGVMIEMACFHIEANVRSFSDFCKKILQEFGEEAKPYLKSAYLGAKHYAGMEEYAKEMDSEDFVQSFDIDNLNSGIVHTQKQDDIVASLKEKAKQSQDYVLDVTPDYYLIKVGEQKIKMQRVHSVMPKAWKDENDKDTAPVQSSLQVGGIFDTLARIFLSDKGSLRRYENNKQQLIADIIGIDCEYFKKEKDHILNKTFEQVFENRKSFENTIDDLYKLGIVYEKLNWELITDPIVWYSNFKKGYVAGETDMLAVDPNGNIHIVDFKTSKLVSGKSAFHKYISSDPTLTRKYSEDLSQLSKSDFESGPRKKGLSAKARQIRKKIAQQENSKILIRWDYDSDTPVAVIKRVGDNFRRNVLPEYRLMSKGQEYSNQLSTYQEIIQSNLYNVTDLEIIGFNAVYTINEDKKQVDKISNLYNSQNNVPLRIKLSFSDEMHAILNNEGQQDAILETTDNKIDPVDDREASKSTDDETSNKNSKYVPPVDLQTLGIPGEVLDKVNTKYRDENGSLNFTDLDYIRIERDKQFVDDTNAYDFITWCIENGSIEIYTDTVKEKGKRNKFVYADVNYKGHIYKRVWIQTHKGDYITPAGKKLLDEVERLESLKKPGQKIVAVQMNRTAGQIGLLKDEKTVSVMDSGLITTDNISDIEFSTSDLRFGFVKNGDVMSFRDGNPDQKDAIFTFRGRNISIPANGSLIFIKETNHKERNVQQYIPIGIQKVSLSNDFDFIIDCLRNIDSLDKAYVFTQNGENIRVDATRRQLLNLLIPYADDISGTENILSIVRDKTQPSVFYITAKNRTHPAVTVNINDNVSVQQFKQALSQLSVTERHEMLTSRLGSTGTNALPVFANIRKFFAKAENVGKTLNISPNLTFDFNDFKVVDSTKNPGKQNDGLTGLGWAIKHGWFVTRYGGMNATNVGIDEVALIEDKPISVEKDDVVSAEEAVKDTNLNTEDILDLVGFVAKRETEFDVNKPKLTKEQIKKNLRPILGNLVDDPNIFKIIEDCDYDNSKPKAKIVGKASSDAITIYNAAFAGVDYHEAFHRIFELYVPEKTRNAIYDKVAKQLGIDLSKSTKENEFYGHRLVAEKVADLYMDTKLNQEKHSKYSFLDRIFTLLNDIVNLFKNLNQLQLYFLFLKTDLGLYKNKKVSSEAKERFETMFGELNYDIHGVEFEHILNDAMYEDVKDTTMYLLTLGQKIDLSGANVQDIQITPEIMKTGADKLKKFGFDIFGQDGSRTAGQEAMKEFYDKFYAASDDIAARFSQISTDYIKNFEESERDKLDGDEESIGSANYEEQIRPSYEFSRFDKSSSRVKFFFSLIPQLEYTNEGKLKFVTNSLGMPRLVPMNYVFNEVLINLCDVDTLDELTARLSNLAKTDPIFQIIYKNISNIISTRVVDGKVDADKEALLAQLVTTIRANRHTFMIVRTEEVNGVYNIYLQTSDADYNAKFYPMQWSQILAKGGTEILKTDNYGRIIFNPNNKYASQMFSKVGKFFNKSEKKDNITEVGLKQMLSSYALEGGKGYQMTVKVIDTENSTQDAIVRKDYVITNLKDQQQCNIIKDKIVEALNLVGIRFTSDEFEYMLKHKYGSSDWEALSRMVNSTNEKDSMTSFLNFLETISSNGKLNIDNEGNVIGMFDSNGRRVKFDNVFNNMAFVKELSNWKWAYRKSHDQLSVLALDGNRFYEMSDNDYLSDVLRGLNKRDKQFEDLKQDIYNYFIGQRDPLGKLPIDGSITLKQLTENSSLRLSLRHFIGFKTDKRGDDGSDYFEMSRREDYLSKATILENSGLAMLTLSDKKKYEYVDGVKLPGFDFVALDSKSKEIAEEASKKLSEHIIIKPNKLSNNYYAVQQNQDIVDQMISYAKCEYEAIKKAGAEIDELEKQGILDQSVVNYYTQQQGAKFSSLLGVWENTYDKNDEVTGEQFISFNDGRKSWFENLAIAEAYFFNRSIEEQRALIARNLQHVLEKELKTVQELGLVQKTETENPYLGYKNVGLNNTQIQRIKQSYKVRYPKISDSDAESLAVVMYLSDISGKALISGQEVERLFSGNPAFYKWKYDEQGRLVDRTVDELKRLGGVGSTGTNNFLELENIPSKYIKDGKFTGKYVQAEADNEMVGSSQIEDIRKLVYEGQLKYLIYLSQEQEALQELEQNFNEAVKSIRRLYKDDEFERDRLIGEARQEFKKSVEETQNEISDRIYNATIEQLERDYPELKELAKIKSDEVSEAYNKKIDVADGAAYITDEMCEMLLRMVGKYSKDVEQAFDILRGRKKANYLQEAEAYRKVLTTVIGSQKYTAFGRRLQNNVSVPYYNKMALFPIFDCIATGKMKNIFDKMKQQGIDVLAINSAVKLGSEGSKPVNWSDFREDNDPSNENNFKDGDVANQNWKPLFEEAFNFNTYEQDFQYLRKQLNTDPTEEYLMRVGTQMQKVAFSNMISGKTYKTLDGNVVRGRDIQDTIMNSMKRLSELGIDKLNKKFFVVNEDGLPVNSSGEVVDRNSSERVLDIKKFAEEASKAMSERGADKNIIKALELIKKQDNSAIPLGAISNSSWIESVLISMVNKEVIDVNTPGSFFIQRSIWAMEGRSMVDKKNIHGATVYNGKELKTHNNKNSMDCVLSLDFFEHIIPKVPLKDSDGNTVYKTNINGEFILNEDGNRIPVMVNMAPEKARDWLISHNIIGENADPIIIGYRIPTQAESSIHALRCVDVLPVVRDTVILPKEFTKITGSDFDIDKLGLSWLNFNKKGTTEFEEGTAEYYQNQLLKSYLTLLTDKDTQHILKRSIDNDTKLLTDIVEKLEKNSGNVEEPYSFYSLSTQTERKNDYITGKIGIGPFALNNNNHILTMMYGIRFKTIEGSVMTELGLTDLSTKTDKDNNSILSWISALINAHVDIAKDPYISKLNVNPFTYNIVNTLIRTGFGKETFYFTTQPIMKEMAKAYMNAKSVYMADPYKTQYQLQKDAIKEVAKNHFENIELPFLKGVSFSDIEVGFNSPEFAPTISDAFKQIVDNGCLEDNANVDYKNSTGTTIQIGKELYHLSSNQVQAIIYLAYLQMEPYATSLSSLVKYSKIDTKKQGNNYIEQQLYKQGFYELFYGDETGGLFEPEQLKDMANDSYLAAKTFGAINIVQSIFSRQFIQSTPGFNNARNLTLNLIGRHGSKDIKLNNKIVQALTAAIKSQFINRYAYGKNKTNPTYIRDLVCESFETDLSFEMEPGSNNATLSNDMKYKPSSYIGGRVYFSFQADYTDKVKVNQSLGNGGYIVNIKHLQDNKAEYVFSFPITGANDDSNQITIPFLRKDGIQNGKVVSMTGGKNTIYDRFNRIIMDISNNPDYIDVINPAGEPTNELLRSLVVGRTFEYSVPKIMPQTVWTETPDTYSNLKFIKLFNAFDNNGVQSNWIIDAWDQMLHDNKHPLLKQFAEDLVVYAFVTSGDKGGFTKFFKQVPFSWRSESGYGAHIQSFINDLIVGDMDQEMIEDAILNNWFDNDFVRTYKLYDKEYKPQFISYSGEVSNGFGGFTSTYSFPLVLAALKNDGSEYSASIDANDAPLFIKIPRDLNSSISEGQRKYTVYRLQDIAAHQNDNGVWVKYPVYVKINPKGVELKGNYLMTEYGRNDSVQTEKVTDSKTLSGIYKISDFISKQTLQEYKTNYGDQYTQIIEDLNYGYLQQTIPDFDERYLTDSIAQNKGENVEYSGVTKIISGGQTGVDTIGLEVGRELGLQTGGTITPGFYREQNVDQYTRQQLEEFGLQEISKELQAGKSGKEFYLPTTEQNVINSDGTVYFASDKDSAGKIATERFAKQHGKPFILNPTAEQLKNWLEKNNISVLNVAGNRGSKIGNMRDSVVNILKQVLNKNEVVKKSSEQQSKRSSVWTKAIGNYSRKSVQNDPTTLYIFTDNTDRTSGGKQYEDGWYKDKYGEGGFGSENNPTTAQIRGLDNAAPISTMRYFYRNHEGMTVADARWKASDIEEFKSTIDSEVEDIKKLWDSGRFTKIVSPNGDGFFNSRIAQISRNSEIGKYLQSKLKELYDYVNISKDAIILNNNINDPDVQEALGKLVKRICKGE